MKKHCSGLPDRTTLRPEELKEYFQDFKELFRSSRPDYIETSSSCALYAS